MISKQRNYLDLLKKLKREEMSPFLIILRKRFLMKKMIKKEKRKESEKRD